MGSKVEVLSRKDLRDLSVISGGLEVIDWILYDTLTVPAAAPPSNYRYFQQAQGTVSLETTNMEIPGQLPAGYKMVAQKICVVPKQGLTLTVASAKDAFAPTHRGFAQFFIGTRPYLQCPVQDLIGGTFQGFAAGGTEIAYVAPRTILNGEMEYSPVIPANYSFSVQLTYDTAPVVVAALPLQVQIVGKLIRPRQG